MRIQWEDTCQQVYVHIFFSCFLTRPFQYLCQVWVVLYKKRISKQFCKLLLASWVIKHLLFWLFESYVLQAWFHQSNYFWPRTRCYFNVNYYTCICRCTIAVTYLSCFNNINTLEIYICQNTPASLWQCYVNTNYTLNLVIL